METPRWKPRRRKSLRRADRKTMPERKGLTVRKSFTLSEVDIDIIKAAVESCGFLSDSEAIRAMIKHFAESALCMKTAKSEEDLSGIKDRILKGR